MINLRSILEQAKSAKPGEPKKLNVLFVGDADTRAPFSYARDILRTGEVVGTISAANVSIQEFPRLLQAGLTKDIDVVCIMFSNIIPGKTTREEEVLQQMYTTAKETGAKVIAITPTSKEFVPYGHVTHENNEKLVQWVLDQNISDYVVNAYKSTGKKNFFEKDGLMLNVEGHEIVARQVLRALNEVDPKIDAAAVEQEKKAAKERKAKNKSKTKDKIKKVTEFKLGSKSPDLIAIQRQLVKLGYEIDAEEIKQGIFGVTTAEAVKQFQTINDLSVTSRLTSKDIAAIKSPGAKAYGALTYMAKSLVNKPEEPADETPDDAETAQDNYAAAASVKKHAVIPKSSQEFFNQWKTIALQHQKEYGIPASITLAQAAIESGFGKSGLTTKYNNFFGITGAYNGKSVKMKNKKGQTFTWRVYPTPEESFEDHASLLSRKYKPKTENPTYVEWAKSLTSGGYAESNYGTNLIKFIKQNGLDEYDVENKPKVSTGNNGRLTAGELVSIGNGMKLEPAAAADYLKMEKAANADGVQFNVTDAYRTYEIQDIIFDWDRYNRTGEKKKKGTNTAAALPGTSNHGWGKAIDVFPATAQQWIKKNGYKYNWSWYEGKSVGEPWHFTWTTDSSKLKEW
jgi:flagellum-specific peptidoglycan hydrolase FlgJ